MNSDRSNEFFIALSLAILIHAAILLFYGANFKQSVTKLPFKVINLKLSGNVGIGLKESLPAAPEGGGDEEEPTVAAPQSQPSPVETSEPAPAQVTPKLEEAAPKAESTHKEESKKAALAKKVEMRREGGLGKSASTAGQPKLLRLPQKPASASNEAADTGGGKGRGAANGISGLNQASGSYGSGTATPSEIAIRYEQALSLWFIKQEGFLEAARREGISGDGVVRLQINRNGAILNYRIEKSTGSRALDGGIMSMLENIRTVPEVPENYPGGQVLEFLIPIRFKSINAL